jgi:plasmid stability protein
MAATVDTAQRRPATAVRIARRVTVGGVRRLTEEVVVADARTEVVAAEHARTEAAEVVDILVAEAAMQEVAATPAAATANDRDKDLDVRSKLCH